MLKIAPSSTPVQVVVMVLPGLAGLGLVLQTGVAGPPVSITTGPMVLVVGPLPKLSVHAIMTS